MRLFALVLTGVIALLHPVSLQAASWPMQGHDPQNTNYSADEQTITRADVSRLHATWTINRALDVVAGNGKLFTALTAGGGVGVFNARTGSQIRRFTDRELGLSSADSVDALAYGNGLLVVASALQIDAINTATYRVVWRRSGGASDLVVSGGTIYTGQACQSGCGTPASEALVLQTGRVLWRHPGNFGNRPVLIGSQLYQSWGEGTGNTRVYNPTSGALIATLSLSGEWIGGTADAYVLHGNSVLQGPRRAVLLTQTKADGTQAWQVSLGKAGYANPALAYGRLYVTSNRFHPGVLSVNAANGHISWATNIQGIVPVNAAQISAILVANHLVFVAAASHLDILDAGTGKLLRQLPSLQADIEQLVVSNGIVYAGTAQGVTAVMP